MKNDSNRKNSIGELLIKGVITVVVAAVIVMSIWAGYCIYCLDNAEIVSQKKAELTDYIYESLMSRPAIRENYVAKLVDDLIESHDYLLYEYGIVADGIIEMATLANTIVASSYLIINEYFKSQKYGLSMEMIDKYKMLRMVATILQLLSFALIPISIFCQYINQNRFAIISCFANFTVSFFLLLIASSLDNDISRRNATKRQYFEKLRKHPDDWVKMMNQCFRESCDNNEIKDWDTFQFGVDALVDAIGYVERPSSKIADESIYFSAIRGVAQNAANLRILKHINNRLLEMQYDGDSLYLCEEGILTLYIWGRILLNLAQNKIVQLKEAKEYAQEIRKGCDQTANTYYTVLRLELECEKGHDIESMTTLYPEQYQRINRLVRKI